MHSYIKIHQHIGETKIDLLMNNKVQEEIQPRGLQSSISFPAVIDIFVPYNMKHEMSII